MKNSWKNSRPPPEKLKHFSPDFSRICPIQCRTKAIIFLKALLNAYLPDLEQVTVPPKDFFNAVLP